MQMHRKRIANFNMLIKWNKSVRYTIMHNQPELRNVADSADPDQTALE